MSSASTILHLPSRNRVRTTSIEPDAHAAEKTPIFGCLVSLLPLRLRKLPLDSSTPSIRSKANGRRETHSPSEEIHSWVSQELLNDCCVLLIARYPKRSLLKYVLVGRRMPKESPTPAFVFGQCQSEFLSIPFHLQFGWGLFFHQKAIGAALASCLSCKPHKLDCTGQCNAQFVRKRPFCEIGWPTGKQGSTLESLRSTSTTSKCPLSQAAKSGEIYVKLTLSERMTESHDNGIGSLPLHSATEERSVHLL